MALHEKIFKIYSSVFLVLGVLSLVSIYGTPSLGDLKKEHLTSRQPASLIPQESKLTEVLKLDCHNPIMEATIRASQVRIEAKNCFSDEDLNGISVQNETTKRSATLFKANSSILRTDYIQLVDGENLISMTNPKNRKIKGLNIVLNH